MSDIKLFKVSDHSVAELAAQSPQVEKSLQTLFERNLEVLLGVRFLATEHSTGAVHGGRIDTLGVDEDGTPVIIEYKRTIDENVINQGLFYLDWLMDHRKDFQWLVMEKLGKEAAEKVDWTAPRLICIAGDFTRYDTHAVKQINRSIELIRYRRFAEDHLLIELAHAPSTSSKTPATKESRQPSSERSPSNAGSDNDPYLNQRIENRLANSSTELRDVWEAVIAQLTTFGDDVQVKWLQYYVAFKRIKNFVCLEIYPQARVVTAYAKINPDSLTLEDGFTRDVRKIGHFGTGDLQISIRTIDDVARAIPLLRRAYEGS